MPERHYTPSRDDSQPQEASRESTPQKAANRERSLSGCKSAYYGLFERDTPEAEVIRSRLLVTAKAHFSCQHHLLIFHLVVVNCDARFIPFDRCGPSSASDSCILIPRTCLQSCYVYFHT